MNQTNLVAIVSAVLGASISSAINLLIVLNKRNLEKSETIQEIIRHKFESRLQLKNIDDRMDRVERMMDRIVFMFDGGGKKKEDNNGK